MIRVYNIYICMCRVLCVSFGISTGIYDTYILVYTVRTAGPGNDDPEHDESTPA